MWPINSETAIVHELDGGTRGIGDVNASLGVDNGLFVWLNGAFMGGHLRPGGVSPSKFAVSLRDLRSGLIHLQILRGEHGATSGHDVSVTGDPYLAPIPLPASGLLLAGSAAVLAGLRRRRRTAWPAPNEKRPGSLRGVVL